MAMTQLEKALEHYKVDSEKTSDDIAELLGVSRQTYYAKIHGDTPLNFKQAKQLADLLGMTLEDFYRMVQQ